MIVIGLLLFAAAIAAGAILIVQNMDATIYVHWLGQNWHVREYWLLVAGLVIAIVGMIGLWMMQGGGRRNRRIRREHRELVRSRADAETYAPADAAPRQTDAAAAPRRETLPTQPGHAALPYREGTAPAGQPYGDELGLGGTDAEAGATKTRQSRLSALVHPRHGGRRG